MSATANEPKGEDVEYRMVRLNVRQQLPEYFSVTVNVAEEKRRATIRRINRMLRGEM